MKSAVDEMNAIVARLADELDMPYYDLMGHMPYNPDFWEWSGYHQSPNCTFFRPSSCRLSGRSGHAPASLDAP
ncbi:MAG TPA: hypothetical protein VMT24_19915 [Aggregatilineaceae bacterium]|nr:hypothetical protein [Aggregatilineaceae bacterium]